MNGGLNIDVKSFIPIIIIQLGMMGFCLFDLYRKKKTKNLNIWAWAAIVILVNILGPLFYLTIGREEE